MQSYITLHNHHIGLSHINNGMECEDYSLSFEDDNLSVAVICDGHGDKNCFRSAIGAKTGCEIAVKKARQFQQYILNNSDCDNLDFDTLLQKLEEDIVNLWKRSVLSDAQENPFTEEELSPLSANVQEIYRNHQRMEKAYGCTLIMAVVMQEYWYALQIGDGKCVAIYDDGVYVEPIPADEENCVGNRSTSICGSHAIEDFRHYWSQMKPLAVYVSSDGIEESFDEKGLFNFYYSITHWVQNDGKEIAEKQIEELLPKISEGGSGDDVSVAGVVAFLPRVSLARQSLEQVETKVIAAENQLSRFSELLANSAEESDLIKKKKAGIDQKIKELTEALTKLTEESDALTVNLEHLNSQVLALQEKKALSEEQVEKAHKYFESARSFWEKKLVGLGLWKEQIFAEAPEAIQNTVQSEVDEDEESDDSEVSSEIESISDFTLGAQLEETIVSSQEEVSSTVNKLADSESDSYEAVEMGETIAVDDIIVPKKSSAFTCDNEIKVEPRIPVEYPVEQNVSRHKRKLEEIEENENNHNTEKRWSIFKRFRGEQ